MDLDDDDEYGDGAPFNLGIKPLPRPLQSRRFRDMEAKRVPGCEDASGAWVQPNPDSTTDIGSGEPLANHNDGGASCVGDQGGEMDIDNDGYDGDSDCDPFTYASDMKHPSRSRNEDEGDSETSRQAHGSPSHANSWGFSGDHDDEGEVHADGSAFPTHHDEETYGADEEPDDPDHVDAGAAVSPRHQNEHPNMRQGGQPYSNEKVLNNFCHPM